ncbi:GNAT family N-acetyltransferase [Haloferula sargassicola]|uniref:GNAT family N-acetyltransferase n=1 Tax=Haloferula sargassicola TaxID=490096 RepID=UPI003365650B
MIAFRQIRSSDLAHWRTLSPQLEAIARAHSADHWVPAGAYTGWVACGDDAIPIAASFACCRSGELLSIFVRREFRGRGIGRELLRQAEAWLRSHGWSEMTADASMLPEQFLIHHQWSREADTAGRLKKIHSGASIPLEEHWLEDAETGCGRLIRLGRVDKFN